MRKYFILFLAIALIFIGCSQNSPEVRNCNSCMSFSYEDGVDFPQARLSIFALTDSNPRRYESIQIKALNNDYLWDLEKPIIIDDGKRTYVGYNNILMPEGKIFPNGNYEAEFITFSGEDSSLNFNIAVDKKLYSLKESDVKKYVKENSFISKVAAYDKDDVLLFWGNLSGDTSTVAEAVSKNLNAAYYKEIWVSRNNQIYIICSTKYTNK